MSTDQFSVLRDLDRAAVLEAARLAGRIQPDDLGRATPCDGWDLAALLAHLSGQHRGFAAAARGRGGDLAVWRSRVPAADPLYRRSVKVSMGAVFAVPYARMTDWYDGLATVRAAGFELLALTPDPAAAPLGGVAAAPGKRTALLLGTEGDGLSSRWRHEADQSVRIPMDPGAQAAGVDSLNVVAAAAIACQWLAGRDGLAG